MLRAAALAFAQIFSPPFRAVLWKSVGLTVALLAGLWFGLLALFDLIAFPYAWLDTAATILTGATALIGLGFLVAPVTAAFAGIFLDDVAEVVEREHYGEAGVGRALPLYRALPNALAFFGIVAAVNLVALPLVLLVGFGVLIFFVANAYLLGREYFELAALRHHDRETARRLRERHGARIFTAGLVVAALLAVPIANLLTPLFGTAFMVHVYKRVAAKEGFATGMGLAGSAT